MKQENNEIQKRGNTYFMRLNKEIIEAETRTAEQLKNMSKVVKQLNDKIINMQFNIETLKEENDRNKKKAENNFNNNNNNQINYEIDSDKLIFLENKIESFNDKFNVMSQLKDDNWFDQNKKFDELEEKMFQFEKTVLERIKNLSNNEIINRPSIQNKEIDKIKLFKRESQNMSRDLKPHPERRLLTL